MFLVSEDEFFWNCLRPIARALRDGGWEVILVTRVQQYGDKIQGEGIRVIPIRLERGIHKPWDEWKTIAHIIRVYRKERPNLVHHFALKPILFGTLAAGLVRIPYTINSVTGLGYLFISKQPKVRLIRRIVITALNALCSMVKQQTILVENQDDRDTLLGWSGLPSERVLVRRCTGVDQNRFSLRAEPHGQPIVAVICRMLWHKGISDIVEAARILHRKGQPARIVLIGAPDKKNPSSIPTEWLRACTSEGIVEWWGFQKDIPSVLRRVHIVVLPSYREGLPKSLLEAAACGLPLIATDVPGCREIVQHGVTGYLVPPHDPVSLSSALDRLIKDKQLRQSMGSAARLRVEKQFTESIVVNLLLDVYRTVTEKA